MAITANIPTPTPALKIPSITEQLENKNKRANTDNDFSTFDFITIRFFKFIITNFLKIEI